MVKTAKPEALITDTDDIEYLVCHVGLLWRRLLNAKIKTLGISGTERRVLFCIARNPGLTQVQIAALLDLEPQNLMRSLDRLEKLDWIQKELNENDRRIKCLYITTHAKKTLNKIQAISDKVKPQILSGIDAKSLQTLVTHLAQMRENILESLGQQEEKC